LSNPESEAVVFFGVFVNDDVASLYSIPPGHSTYHEFGANAGESIRLNQAGDIFQSIITLETGPDAVASCGPTFP